jgi:hypothetical protein
MQRCSQIRTTFDNTGRLLRLFANIGAGWRRLLPSGRYGFWEVVKQDLTGDWSVKIHLKLKAYNEIDRIVLDARQSLAASLVGPRKGLSHDLAGRLARKEIFPNYVSRGPDFPQDLERFLRGQVYKVVLLGGMALIEIDLQQAATHILGRSQKPGVWDKRYIGRWREIDYRFDLLVVFTPPHGRTPGDIREWDLLPFLPGGLPETDRRRF